MESAERKGSALRRRLLSADRFNDAAMRLGSFEVKTPRSSVSASLCSVTWWDQRRPPRLLGARLALAFEPRLVGLRVRLLAFLDAVAFLAMRSPRSTSWSTHHSKR